MILALALCSLWTPGMQVPPAAQELGGFMPVGVRYRPARNAATQRRDLEEMRRLHFTVVAVLRSDKQAAELHYIDRMLAGAPYSRIDAATAGVASVIAAADGPETTARAWSALARGARVILFGDWTVLQRNQAAKEAAAGFAEAVVRNATLYAPMRPRVKTGVTVSPQPGDVRAAMLESPDALLVIAINDASTPRKAVLTLASDVPEAIWQNMITGTTLSFVTTPEGSTYTRTFAPKEVVVLMINKRVRSDRGSGARGPTVSPRRSTRNREMPTDIQELNSVA